MLPAFESPREVLCRARDHINDLEARIEAFFARQPYARVIDFDRDAGQEVHKIRLTAKLPGGMAAIAKDAFGNLRDALDHAVYASAVEIRPGHEPKRTGFPFADSAAGVHDKLNKELIDVPPAIRTLLEGFQPYPTGNQTIWSLSRARNLKTHRVLVPLGAVSIGNSLTITDALIRGPSQIGYNVWNSTKNEVEYLRVGPGSHVNYQVKIAFDVLFGEVDGFSGQPALPTLHNLASVVEGILLCIEAETARVIQTTSNR